MLVGLLVGPDQVALVLGVVGSKQVALVFGLLGPTKGAAPPVPPYAVAHASFVARAHDPPFAVALVFGRLRDADKVAPPPSLSGGILYEQQLERRKLPL